MGTKSLSIIVKDGKVKVAQYGESKGYPFYMGIEALTFARDKIPLDSQQYQYFIEKLNQCTFMDNEEFEKTYLKDTSNTDYLINVESAEIFNSILKTNVTGKIYLQNDYEFAADSSKCYWGYVIDLDKQTFEVYRGWNTFRLPKNERFYELNNSYSHGYPDIKFKLYYPIKLFKQYSLKDLPSNEDFLKDFGF